MTEIKENRHDIFIPAIKRLLVDGGIPLKDATSTNWETETELAWLYFCTKFEWVHTKFPSMSAQHDKSKVAIFQRYWDEQWNSKSEKVHRNRDANYLFHKKKKSYQPHVPNDLITIEGLKKITRNYYRTPLKEQDKEEAKRKGTYKPAKKVPKVEPVAAASEEYNNSIAPSIMSKLSRPSKVR